MASTRLEAAWPVAREDARPVAVHPPVLHSRRESARTCASLSCPPERCCSRLRLIRTMSATAWWHAVGKVCLHLAENRGDEEHPFGFLATYAVRAGVGGKVQHRPLARALEDSSARGDRRALLHLLVPLQRAAEQVKWLAELVESGGIYEAMAWTPAEAHAFLKAIPAFEAAGLVVRVPHWWRTRRPPRPEVAVRVGDKKPSAGGMEALLDFSVAVALGDVTLTAPEGRQLMAASGGLVRLG